MVERTIQRLHAFRKRPVGRVIPFRPLAATSRKTADSKTPTLSSSGQETIVTTLHAIQNCIQTVSMGLDLMQIVDTVDLQNYDPVRRGVDRAGRLLLELREYCCPSGEQRWVANITEIIEDVVQEVAREWERPGRTTRVMCHDPEAMVEADWRQVEKTLARTVFCAYAMLPPEGGEVVVEAQRCLSGLPQLLDIRVRSHSVIPFSVDEEALFAPFTSINGHQLGLSLVLAQLTAQRLGGHLRFHKLSSRQGCFKLGFRI